MIGDVTLGMMWRARTAASCWPVALPLGEDGRTDRPREDRHAQHGDSSHDREKAGAENGHHHQGEQDGGEGEHGVHEAHEDRVERSAEIAAGGAEGNPG
jgi:hypothetical protein